MSATKIIVLATHDEQGIFASLHRDTTAAYEELRQYLNNNPVDYQDPLMKDASHEQISDAANDRSQFIWGMSEQEVPA